MNKYDIYKQYLESDTWAELRNQALKRDKYHCSICNNPNNLEVHHLKYPETLGTEPISDLMTLCRDCHKKMENYKSGHKPNKMLDWKIPTILVPHISFQFHLKECDKDLVDLIAECIEENLRDYKYSTSSGLKIILILTYGNNMYRTYRTDHTAKNKEDLEKWGNALLKRVFFSEYIKSCDAYEYVERRPIDLEEYF